MFEMEETLSKVCGKIDRLFLFADIMFVKGGCFC